MICMEKLGKKPLDLDCNTETWKLEDFWPQSILKLMKDVKNASK